jgi:hypothetical protein
MKTLVAAVATGVMGLVGADVALAGGADFMLGVPLKYWIDIIVLLLVLNLLCCWWRRR